MTKITYVDIIKGNKNTNMWESNEIRISRFLELVTFDEHDLLIERYNKDLLYIIKKIREEIKINNITLKEFFANKDKINDLLYWIKENGYNKTIEHIYLDIYDNSEYCLRENIFFIEIFIPYNYDIFNYIGSKNKEKNIIKAYIKETKYYLDNDFEKHIFELCKDKEIAYEFMTLNQKYILYLSKIYDDDFIRSMIKEFPAALYFMDYKYQNDLEWVDNIFKNTNIMCHYIDDNHKYRKYVILNLINVNNEKNLYINLKNLNIKNQEINEYQINKILTKEYVDYLLENRKQYDEKMLLLISNEYSNDNFYFFYNNNSNYQVAKTYISNQGLNSENYSYLCNNLRNKIFIKDCLKNMKEDVLINTFFYIQQIKECNDYINDYEIFTIFLKSNISFEDIYNSITNKETIDDIIKNKDNIISIIKIIKEKKDNYDLLWLFNIINKNYYKDIKVFKNYFDALYTIKNKDESIVDIVNEMHYDTKNNIDIANKIISIDSNCFEFMGLSIRNNGKIVKMIRDVNPYMLRYASLKQQFYNIFI